MISNNSFEELYDGVKRLSDDKIRTIYGMNPELFYSLPYEIQCALIHSYWEITHEEHDKIHGEKVSKPTIEKYKLEKKVKVKVLSIFKKKK